MTLALPSPVRSLAVVLATLAGLVSGCRGDEPASSILEPRVRESGFFGVNGQNLRPMAADGRAAILDRHLGSITDLELDFVRASFSWPDLEPGPPAAGGRRYDFTSTDAWVEALARHGLRWYATVKGNPTPAWALAQSPAVTACGERAPPARDADFAALAAAIASRYGGDGSFWAEHPELPHRPLAAIEIWNEPNFGIFWCPRPDPAAYASLLTSSVARIRESDPDARIVLGGLAGFRTGDAMPGQAPRMAADEFLSELAETEPAVAEGIDAIGIHPYGADSQAVLGTLGRLREQADAAGLGDLPISVSEIGWRVGGGEGSVTEEQHESLLRDATRGVVLSGCDIADISPHTWITEERDPLEPEDWFGLADPATAEPYGSIQAYADLASDFRRGQVGEEVDATGCEREP